MGDGEGWASLTFCSPWGHKESDVTERLNTKFWLIWGDLIVVLISLSLIMSDVENFFRCLFAIYIFWRNVCLDHLPTFWLSSFWYWVAWEACLFCELILCLLFHLLLLFSHSEGCLFTLFMIPFKFNWFSLVHFWLYFHYPKRWILIILSFSNILKKSLHLSL